MRDYNYNESWKKLITPEIALYLTRIYEYKSKLLFQANTKKDVLKSLVDDSRIQSTKSSNFIEGIYTTPKRLYALVKNSTDPKNRNEQEIAGYKDVLEIINDSYEFIPINSNHILQLHGYLYKFDSKSTGGQFKISDNVIKETDANGIEHIRFKPVPAYETKESVDRLCEAYDNAIKDESIEPLILISMFVLDFLCIHPFNDGNGRLSRLLTLLLLFKQGFDAGKYISIERLIEETKDNYYYSLKESSNMWHEGNNSYYPFVKYMLEIILSAYKEFDKKIEFYDNKQKSKPDRISEMIKNSIEPITKTEILKAFNDISQVTVQRTLAKLIDDGSIQKIGGGRYTKYIWIK